MDDIKKEKKLAVREYVKMKNEEDTPTQLKEKNAIMRRALNKLRGYVNQMVMEYEDEDVFEELVVLANEIQVALKKEEEV
jgi:uncharacterized protein YlxP (DUF503 family)